MKKFVMATMMCIGLGAGNSAMAADVAGNKGIDAMMQVMGDTCAIAGKVIITDRLNGLSQQQAEDSFQGKYVQEFNKRDSDSMAVNLANITALSNNPELDTEMVNNSTFKLIKGFSDYLIPRFFTAAWMMSESDVRGLQENKVEAIDYFAQGMGELCQEQVYEVFQDANNSN